MLAALVVGVAVAVLLFAVLGPDGVFGTKSAGPGAPLALTVDDLAAPVGLGLTDVYFGWHVGDSRRGAVQSAYRIVVSRPVLGGPKRGAAPVVWDSGKVLSAAQAFVPYGGRALAPDTTYRWTVQTWDGAGIGGPLARRRDLRHGLARRRLARGLDQATHGRDVGHAGQRSMSRTNTRHLGLQGRVQLRPEGGEARRLSHRAGPRVRVGRPAVRAVRERRRWLRKGEAYSYPDSQYYETTDVTQLLQAGRGQRVRDPLQLARPDQGPPGGHAGRHRPHLGAARATARSTRSPPTASWRVLPGAWLPGVQRDEEGDLVDYTENIDGPAEPVGWDEPGFATVAWKPATVIGPHPHRAVDPSGVGADPHRRRARARGVGDAPRVGRGRGRLRQGLRRGPDGHLPPRACAGRLVTMHAGYLLDDVGARSRPRTGHAAHQHELLVHRAGRRSRDVPARSTTSGSGTSRSTTRARRSPRADIVALTRHDAVPDENAGTFTSSNPTVDAVFELGRHSALFTMQEQFVDTPTREKGSWLWDGFNESADGDGRLRRAEPDPQVAARVRPVAGALLAERCDQQDLSDRARRAGHHRVHRDTTPSGSGSTGCTPATGRC